MDKFDELKKYKELLDEGIISQIEFDQKKNELLESPAGNNSKIESEIEGKKNGTTTESSSAILEELDGQYSNHNEKSMLAVSGKVPKKLLAIIIAIIIVVIAVLAIPSGVDADKKALKKCLLNPSSLIIYEAYVNKDYGGASATVFYFGAENKGGGITDDWAFVQDGEVQFYSTYEDGQATGDTQAVLSCGDVILAKTAVMTGNPAWQEVNP